MTQQTMKVVLAPHAETSIHTQYGAQALDVGVAEMGTKEK